MNPNDGLQQVFFGVDHWDNIDRVKYESSVVFFWTFQRKKMTL